MWNDYVVCSEQELQELHAIMGYNAKSVVSNLPAKPNSLSMTYKFQKYSIYPGSQVGWLTYGRQISNRASYLPAK
jgi:hypothetical protein